jgi:hypothetical protein
VAVCEDDRVIFARRLTIALLLAGFRMWRRLPPEDRQMVVNAIRRHAPRVASTLSRRRRLDA